MLRYLEDKPEIKQRLIDDDAYLRTATEEFLRCLENAFWSWGGVPKTLVLDNLEKRLG